MYDVSILIVLAIIVYWLTRIHAELEEINARQKKAEEGTSEDPHHRATYMGPG